MHKVEDDIYHLLVQHSQVVDDRSDALMIRSIHL